MTNGLVAVAWLSLEKLGLGDWLYDLSRWRGRCVCSTVVYEAGNFTTVSDTLFKVGVLTGYIELAAACTVMLAVFELVSASADGVVILTLPPDVNVLHNILRSISLLCNVSVSSS
jgi:hypothetical protein